MNGTLVDLKIIMDAICTIFEPEKRRMQSIIDNLVKQNQEILGVTDQGFLYQGDVYYKSKATMHSRLPALAWSLCDQMETFIREKRLFSQEFALIKQTVTRLLYLAKDGDAQMQRDLLPDCLASLVPGLRVLTRQKHVEEMIINDERLLRQYLKALPLMEVYSVSRLLY